MQENETQSQSEPQPPQLTVAKKVRLSPEKLRDQKVKQIEKLRDLSKEKQKEVNQALKRAKYLEEKLLNPKLKSEKRQQEDRQKMLLGAFVYATFKSAETDPATFRLFDKSFEKWLVRDADRAVFKLASLSDPNPASLSLPISSPASAPAEAAEPQNEASVPSMGN